MRKIAIIEDDQAISQMYRIKFEAEGYSVKVAADGVEGLELITTLKPDIVLLDLMMPQMGGVEMLTKLRAKTGFEKTKVLVLTNIGEQELPPELSKLGVEGIIMKAYHTPAQVVERVEEAL